MAGYPVANTDTVLYEKKDIYSDKDLSLNILDGSNLNIWGSAFYNGSPLTDPTSLAAAIQVDSGQGWAAKRAISQQNEVWTLLGDSTGNEVTEWIYLLGQQQATDVGPVFRVEYYLWNDTTQAYAAPVLIQDGTTTPVTVVDDTFTGTGDLYGSVPDTKGGGWSGPTGAIGIFTRGGGVITKTTGFAGLTSEGGMLGSKTINAFNVVMNTLNTGVTTQLGIGIQLDGLNQLYVQVNISSSGSRSWIIGQRLANVFTTLATGVNTDIPASATATFSMQLTVVGSAVTATVNGATISATLSTAAQAVFDTTSQMLLLSSQTGTGFTVDRVNMIVTPTAGTVRRLRIYNAAMPGSTLAYHIPKLTKMTPEVSDLLWISIGHNYGTDVGPTILAEIDSVITSVRSTAPNTGIICSGQNPQYPPASGAATHQQRQAAVRSYALRRRYGYLKIWEAFTAGVGSSGVQSDGVHPNSTGSALWKDTAEAYLQKLVVI